MADSDGNREHGNSLNHSKMKVNTRIIPIKACLRYLNDLFQVITSVVDIVLDIAVAVQFYENQWFEFFWASMIIFGIAQISYAFLFVALWGKEITSIKGRLMVFFSILPFAQLVPIFTWIESFHFKALDNMIRKAGLIPTATLSLNHDEGSIFTIIQQKYGNHAGFLVEALVEALPQSILQIIAMIVYQKASVLSLSSILLSIIVISSKSYMISFSIHLPTFIFNCIAVAGDTFGLFALFVWLFSSSTENGVFANPFYSWGLNPEGVPAEPFFQFVASLFLITIILVCFTLMLIGTFSNMDDHLKILLKKQNRWSHASDFDSTYIFDFYVVRTFGILLATVPVSVIVLSMKLTVLPAMYLESLNAEYAMHSKFYTYLFRFLYASGDEGLSDRLLAVNSIIAKVNEPDSRRMLRYSITKQAFQSWMSNLFRVKNSSQSSFVIESTANAQRNYAVMFSDDNLAIAASNPEEVIKKMKAVCHEAQSETEWNDLLSRSVIIKWLAAGQSPEKMDEEFTSYCRYYCCCCCCYCFCHRVSSRKERISNPPIVSEILEDEDSENDENSSTPMMNRMNELKLDTWQIFILRILATGCLFLGCVTLLILVPILFMQALLAFFPIGCLIRILYLLSIGSVTLLPAYIIGIALTVSWILCFSSLVVMYPYVKRNKIWKGLIKLEPMPAHFYEHGDVVLHEMFCKYRAIVGQRKLSQFLEIQSCPETTRMIYEFVGKGKNNIPSV